MTKIRVFVFLLTILIVGTAGLFISYYARGYRLNLKTLKFQPNGILVIQSEPTGSSVYIDGEFKTATNASVPLPPGTYDVEVKRDGYFTWYKRLTVQKEIVTEANVSLFRSVPSLTPITFWGAVNPQVSSDGTKIAFAVPPTDAGSDKTGLWVMDTFTLPLGFTNDPKRITDGDMTNAIYVFSPDNRQILLTTGSGVVNLIDSTSFTAQTQRVNIASQKNSTLTAWNKEMGDKNTGLIKNLPPEMGDILTRKVSSLTFSPDDNLILYTASASANLPDNLIRPFPGASTQEQRRQIQTGQTYIYDIKEDRNFLISNQPAALRFMPDSHHLLLAEDGRIVIMDYDGTNRQTVYSGSYIAPFAFPFTNATRLLILTNLGASFSAPNMYTLTIK